MGCCSARCGLIAGAVIGALLAILGGVLIPAGDLIIRGTVEKEAVLMNGSTAFENFVSTGATVYRQFWIFNVTNPTEVADRGDVPKVEQKGPYTYKTRYLPKANLTFTDNYTLYYDMPLGAIFEPSMSVGPEEDEFMTINLVVAVASSILPPSLLQALINHGKHKLFHPRTVKSLLWGENKDVGLFSPYNGTTDGRYHVYTGEDNINKVGIIERWNGNEALDFWGDKYCNQINGTDASSFPPFIDKNKPLYFFSSDICRSVSAAYQHTVELKGIPVYRFTLLPNTLAAPVDNPDNQCYCTDAVVTKNCTVAGALDVGSCKGVKGVYISLPHFLHGSDILRENVQGLNPIEAEHMTYLDVEPTTGFTLGFAKRIQVNMLYGPKNVTLLEKVKDYTIFPVVWLNETASVDEATAEMFKRELLSRIDMLEIIQYTLLGVGLGIFVLCLLGVCMVKKTNSAKLA